MAATEIAAPARAQPACARRTVLRRAVPCHAHEMGARAAPALGAGARLGGHRSSRLRARAPRAAPEPGRGNALRSRRHRRALGACLGDALARVRRLLSRRGRRHCASAPCRASSKTTRRLLDPTLQALRAIPSIAWVPLFILWLGIFEASKVALIAVGIFFPVYLGVTGAILSVDRKLVEVGRVFRLSRFAMARRILLAGRAAAGADVVAGRARARLHVRGRGRVHGRVRGPRLSPGRRAADRQARPDRGGHHHLRADRQSRRQPPGRRHDAARALAGYRAGAPCKMLTLERLSKTYADGTHALADITLDVREIGDRRADRRLRLRQDHPAPPDRRPRPRQRRRHSPRWRDHRRAAPGHRHRLPGAAPPALADGRRQRRLRARGPARSSAARARRPCARQGRPQRNTPTAGRAICRAASSSASPSPAPSWPTRRCCSSTSPSRRSTPSPGPACTSICSACGTRPVRPFCSSPTMCRRP